MAVRRRDMSEQELLALAERGRAVLGWGGLPRLIEHADEAGAELITKVFVRSARPSSGWVRSYRARFAANAARLRALGFAAPQVTQAGVVRGTRLSYVTYARLAGTALRELAGSNSAAIDVPALMEFIRTLHDRGVYFRSLHLGNVLLLPDGSLGVIDVLDVRFRRRPLSDRQRARNLSFLTRYPDDLAACGLDAGSLGTRYLEACPAGRVNEARFRTRLAAYVRSRGGPARAG